MANEVNQIRVPMNGGFLIAERNGDTTDYDGISIMFETAEGFIIDIVGAECKSEFERKQIDVYTYEDAYDDDFTRKYILKVEDIYKAIGEEDNCRIVYTPEEV